MEPQQQLIPLTNVPALQAAGLPWETEDQVRWAARRSGETGTAAAFVRVGRRIYCDPAKFHELARSRAA
jgi:hypothetical protein